MGFISIIGSIMIILGSSGWASNLQAEMMSQGRAQPKTRFDFGNTPPDLHAPGLGAGVYGSERTEARFFALKGAMVAALRHPLAEKRFGRAAVLHLRHYFRNTGDAWEADMEALLSESPTARAHFDQLVFEVQEWAHQLPIGGHDFVMTAADKVVLPEAENTNWHWALGAYQAWVAGRIEVMEGGEGRTYHMSMTYNLWDPYDWDLNGDKARIPLPFFEEIKVEISNELMGEFHRQGLAREYLVTGEYPTRRQWVADRHRSMIAATPMPPPVHTLINVRP